VEDLEIFVTVVDTGSFTAAAAVLEMTVTAASRRLKALEQRLGVRLLNRTTRRLSLTEAGQIYYDQVRRMLSDLRDTEAQLTQLTDQLRGQLRITAPMSFGVRRLAPQIARFALAHPQLQVQLQLDDQRVDIIAQGLDMALRIGYPQDSSLVARPLLPIARYICAAPAYLRERGIPERPLDLLQHSCLHYNNPSVREAWTLAGPHGPESFEVQGRFCSNNGEALCTAAVQGLGIVILPDFIVERALAEHRLQRILPGFEPPPFTLYALYPSRHFVPAKIRLLLDFLILAAGQGAFTQRGSGTNA
jgi:DNA-binding transcriptional LysR family regulator